MAAFICLAFACSGADIPTQAPHVVQDSHPSYYWKVSFVENGAQLLTLTCHACQDAAAEQSDLPLIAVLRDTLGDDEPDNDRVIYVWLLSYTNHNLGQKILSAVPFFYWRVGHGSKSVKARNSQPLFDLTTPQYPVLNEVSRNVVQWMAFDPLAMPVRATTRAYRTNQVDNERLHLEQAVSYLRQAPVSQDAFALTQDQLNTVIARLELRKELLGGLVGKSAVGRFGKEAGFQDEVVRSRNWELLRQCAERTGLFFEPVNLAGTDYGIIWFPLHQTFNAKGISVRPIWKLLNIHDPWSDERLQHWEGASYSRYLSETGALLPPGESSDRTVSLVPLGFYSLSYPRMPLLLIDFRDKLHVRRHEMTQRAINEITAGVIGISHFTNWYYYVAADLYDFVVSRHGAAMDQAARLDSYSRFRTSFALATTLDPQLQAEIQKHANSLAINPLDAAPAGELQAARLRYDELQREAQDGGALVKRLDKARRYELATLSESQKARVAEEVLHLSSLGLYTHRAKAEPTNIVDLDRLRRLQHHLGFLETLAAAGTPPEVAYSTALIQQSVIAVKELIPQIAQDAAREHAEKTLAKLSDLSKDDALQAECILALNVLKENGRAVHATTSAGIATTVYGSSYTTSGRSAEFIK